MEKNDLYNRIEALLFVSGDPAPISDIARVFSLSAYEMKSELDAMETFYRESGRGIQLLVTEESVQLTSNPDYIDTVEAYFRPDIKRSASKSILETLAIVAYRQPVTKADMEKVRGVLCDYAVGQLVKMGLIAAVGHKDTPGRPILYGTTDAFLRQFGLHSLEELPDFERFSVGSDEVTTV